MKIKEAIASALVKYPNIMKIPVPRYRDASKIPYEERIGIFLAIASRICPEFSIGKNNKELVSGLVKWSGADKDSGLDVHKGIFLFGAQGRGKSILVKVLCQFLKEIKSDVQFQYISCNDIVAKLSIAKSSLLYLRSFKKDSWVINDLGMEEPFIFPLYGEKIKPMRIVVDAVYDSFQDGRFYIFTSNHSLKTIADTYGERTAYLIKEMCNILPVSGENLRQNETKN